MPICHSVPCVLISRKLEGQEKPRLMPMFARARVTTVPIFSSKSQRYAGEWTFRPHGHSPAWAIACVNGDAE